MKNRLIFMIPIAEIQKLRSASLGNAHFSIEELHSIEAQDAVAKQFSYQPKRCDFLVQIADLRIENIFSKVLQPQQRSDSLKHLTGSHVKLKALVRVLPTSNLRDIHNSFFALPTDFKNWLYWAAEIKKVLSPNYQDRDFFLILREAEDKIIYLKGKTLVEQLAYFIEEQISLESQREIVHCLEKLLGLLHADQTDTAAFFHEFTKLPLQLQHQVHEDIYHSSDARQDIPEWGKKALEQNPKALFLSHSSHQTILEYHMQKQLHWLESCETASAIGEFEKASWILSQQGKLDELLRWLVPRARIWLQSFNSPPSPSILTPKLENQHPILANALYKIRGAQPSSQGTIFRVHAPHAKQISLVLTAHGRSARVMPMKKNEAGIWEIQTNRAIAGSTYVYEVTDCHGRKMTRIDPVSLTTFHSPTNDHIHSVVVDQEAYAWGDAVWMSRRKHNDPMKRPLSIYEVQAKSWKMQDGSPLTYRQLALELIPYCKTMGFTHVELYAVQEHIWHISHGYQISNYFAPYHELGSCEDFKYLVDQLHQHDIGVIIDWVPAHFQHYHDFEKHSSSFHEFDGTDLYAAEETHWGTRYLDFGKEETRHLLLASAIYWLDQMHVDGFRVDAVSQIVQRGGKPISSGIAFLKEFNEMIGSAFPGVLKIAEESEDFPNVTKAVSEGGLGFDLKWGMRWNGDTRNYLRTPYQERTKEEHFEDKIINYLKFCQVAEKVLLTQSHDDCDSKESDHTLYRYASHGPDEQTQCSDLKNFFCWQILAPSRGHLIHMGEEWAQPDSWYPRIEKNASGANWQILSQNLHARIQECVKDLIHLYVDNPPFWEKGEAGFRMISECRSNAVIAYHRESDHDRIAVIHNFRDIGYSVYDVPLNLEDTRTGSIKKAYEIFNSDSRIYGGTDKFTNRQVEILKSGGSDIPTHFRIALPPLSTVVLQEDY